ncbi:MAG: tRNA pseudouridine(55) synthase TruB [Acholeplasmatales bacterium]|jgi:tRNA pseudouridine55 synthase|nr:tRNA pseudouridine(55) synthase TruB [Acholeplasmatales bacterium]
MDGILLLDKASGVTSFKAINTLRRKLGLTKVGHTGTLDPLATGLMVVLVGKATKIADLFKEHSKEYVGEAIFGIKTDTLDITGTILERNDKIITASDIDSYIDYILKLNDQKIPSYSAKKINGKKMYELARKNKEIPDIRKPIEVYSFLRTSDVQNNCFSFQTSVSAGTFVREILNDLAAKVGTFSSLKTLRRTKIDDFSIEDAKTIDLITISDIIDITKFLDKYQSIVLDDYLINLVRNGVVLDSRQIITEEPFRVLDKNNNLIALYKQTDTKYTYKPVVIL